MKFFLSILVLAVLIGTYFAYRNHENLTASGPLENETSTQAPFNPKLVTKINNVHKQNTQHNSNRSNNGPINIQPQTIYLTPENNNSYEQNDIVPYDEDYFVNVENEPSDEQIEEAAAKFNRAPAGIDQNPNAVPKIIPDEESNINNE